jgi:hypothetical protein
MLKRIWKFLWRTALVLGFLVAVDRVFRPKARDELFAAPRTFTVDEVPKPRVAIVFGAGCCVTVRRDLC